MVAVKEIAANIFSLRVPVPVSIEDVNAYIFTGDVPTVLDVGTNVPGSIEVIRAGLQKLGIKRVEQVLITHWHMDHAGGAAAFASEGAKVLISPRDFREWSNFTDTSFMDNTQSRIYAEWGVPRQEAPGMLAIYKGLLKLGTLLSKAEFLQANQKLRAGNEDLTVIPTPGHTPGHLSFYSATRKVLFSGDQLLPDQIPYPGSWFTEDRLTSGLPDYLASLDRIEALEALEYFPAHGLPQLNPSARCQEVREQIYQQVEKHRPQDTVYAGATLGKSKLDSGTLFMKLHYVFGWEAVAKQMPLGRTGTI